MRRVNGFCHVCVTAFLRRSIAVVGAGFLKIIACHADSMISEKSTCLVRWRRGRLIRLPEPSVCPSQTSPEFTSRLSSTICCVYLRHLCYKLIKFFSSRDQRSTVYAQHWLQTPLATMHVSSIGIQLPFDVILPMDLFFNASLQVWCPINVPHMYQSRKLGTPRRTIVRRHRAGGSHSPSKCSFRHFFSHACGVSPLFCFMVQ